MSKRVAILTGGGDVPGLNVCIKRLVYQLIDLGYEPIGVRKGWEGLLRYNPLDPTTYSDNYIELTKNMVRPIDRSPGSFLHSSRLDPRQTPVQLLPEHIRTAETGKQDATSHITDVIQRLQYHALVIIGDDDMLHYAAHLSQLGIPIVAIPKTIHNNIQGTDYTLGFSTGLARAVAFIHELRALAGSREQVVVVETFAAHSGYSTLLMAYLAGVDRVVIPEVPFDPEKLANFALMDKKQNPSNYSIITVCDGAQMISEKIQSFSDHLSPSTRFEALTTLEKGELPASEDTLAGSGMLVAELLNHLTQEDVILQQLTYLLRTGPPDGQDLLGAANFALTAARLVKEEFFGRMTAFLQDYMWFHVDLNQATDGIKTVDVETSYDTETYKPKQSLIWSAFNR